MWTTAPDEGGGLGEAVRGVVDLTRLWVRERARIPTHLSRLGQDVVEEVKPVAHVFTVIDGLIAEVRTYRNDARKT